MKDLIILLVLVGLWTIAVVSLIWFIFYYFEYKADKKKYDNYFKEFPDKSSNPLNNPYYSSYDTSQYMMKITIKMAAIGFVPALIMSFL